MIQHTHFGCYGILTLGDCIALIRKARGPYTGLLDLPGGKPEFGEHPDAAVIRRCVVPAGIGHSRRRNAVRRQCSQIRHRSPCNTPNTS